MTDRAILHNIRILDFTRVLAGPYATRLLADFGAEVVKVQMPHQPQEDAFGQGYYRMWNRNKLGITLDPGKPQGIDLARRLVVLSDAVVENFAPRVMANWGLDYPRLREIKPDIIMLSMSVLGQTGPWRDYTGFGPTVQALSGMARFTAQAGGPPLVPGFSYADHAAGLMGALSLLAALEHRRRTGEGQFIDLSETEAMVSLLGEAFLEFGMTGREPQGNRFAGGAPHGIYPCLGEDRWCAIAVHSDVEWQAFKTAIGRPSWAGEERFDSAAGRLENAAELDRLVARWTRENRDETVMALLQRHGLAAGLVQNAADLLADPQLRARGFFVDINGEPADASPVRLSDGPAQYLKSAPSAGEDNDYVYRGLLGLTGDEMADLQAAGVI
ncbi:MAG: CoA transferase [Chloroflexi bacterium]|nr:CoA transferase [Chloroflexota bacterium]